MEESTSGSQTLFPHETGHEHHRLSRERQRKGPMWGCLKGLIILIAAVFLILFFVIGGGWWYIGTASFADLVRVRVEDTLKARLGRDVSIRSVEIPRGRPQRIILRDLRIANSPGAVSPYFATVKEVVITGGVESFWSRRIKVRRVDVLEPRLFFEVYPAGATLTHNFPHWDSGPPSKHTIVHLEIGQMFINNGGFLFLDRRHQISAESTSITSTINVKSTDLYEGVMNSPLLHLRIQDYEPIDVDMRGGIRYTPGVLALNSIALRGRGIEAFISGNVAPLTEGVYNLRITSQIGLDRVREIFRVQKLLQGTMSLDTNLTGRQGDFKLTGGWVSPRITADAYDLTSAKGRLEVTGQKTIIDVEKATYGGGAIGAHYTLSQYAEPYPMNVDLRYDRISVEQLFNDWKIENTGLRGAATGQLSYHWNKDKVLEGAGEGSARLSKNATAFSGAKYPIPVAGSADFALNRGVIAFKRLELDTNASHVSIAGTLRIDDAFTDWRVKINSTDFSELDRAAYNFAHSAGKKKFTLLGLGGAGEITGTVNGRLKAPAVIAHISATGTKYNNVLLGASNIDLHYNGVSGVLMFDRATFSDNNGRLALTGTISFPDRGPSPRFDIAVDATNYPVDRAIKAVDLKMAIGGGTGTGRMLVSGTPDSGKVTFAGLTIHRASSQLALRGDVEWLPGKGNVRFDLDIDAKSFPVADIITFLDLGSFPVTGDVTGTLHLAGQKNALEGGGAITVRNGLIYGEPIDVVSADIAFTKGKLRATSVSITAPAGQITGEAELNLSTNQFSYTIQSSSIDLSRVKLLSSLSSLLGGKVRLNSSGGGTFDNPELVVEATLNEATLRGLSLPPDSPPPSLYIAIRGGKLIVRGSAANVLAIEGEGAVGPNLTVDGNVRITISDIARLLAMSPSTATMPASGNAVIDLRLGGQLTSLEALRIDATVPTLSLRVSEHEFRPRSPLKFALHDGRVVFESFDLQRADSTFSLTGFAEITKTKKVGIDLNGSIEAALLQLFMPDVHAGGLIALSTSIRGTLDNPLITGSAELQNAQVRFAGFPQLIDNINGTLVFKGDRIDIDSIRATVGGGTVVAGGFVTVAGLRPQRARVTLQGTDVAIRYFEGVTVEGNFNLLLSGDVDRVVLQGDVNVSRALYFREFNLQQSVLNVLLSRRGITPIVAASWQDRVDLRMHLNAPDTLAVKNNIADVTGSAEIDLAGTLANPVVLGIVTLNEGGTVTFQNVDYRLVRGTINFQNPFRIDPYFDVTLEGRVSGISEVEAGPLDVTINITGTLDRITPSISSDPPASDITLFSILGFGALTRGSNGITTPGSAIGSSLLQQSLFSYLGQRILPFADSFTYDPGLIDTGSGAGPRVTFEKRLSNAVRLLVVYDLDRHQSREVVEFTASRDWTIQLTFDELSSEYRAEGRFRRRYEGRWSWGRRGRNEVFPLARVSAAISETTAPALATTRVQSVPAGTPVAEVRFRSDGVFETSSLRQYVAVPTGSPVSLRTVQSSIKALYATGNFRDIRVDTTAGPSGAVITFSLFLNYRAGRITFDGITGSTRGRAQRDLTVRIGDVLSLNAVDRSAVAIAEDLKRNGQLGATVDPETNFVRERNVADIIFHVTPGPQAIVGTVTIEGDFRPFSTSDLVGRMRGKPGRGFNVLAARGDADRIKAYLLRKNYRRADVDFLGHTYDPASNAVALRYRATAGPLVRVEVEGVPRRAVRRQIPFHGTQEYSEDVIDKSASDIERLYQQRGYYRATVDTESGLKGDTWVTTFKIKPGQRYRLSHVTFSGNIRLSDKELKTLVATAPGGGIKRLLATVLRRPTGVTASQLSADRDTLESHYRLQGFSEAVVTSAVVETKPDGTMTIDFPISEGPQTIVSAVRVEGTEQVDTKSLPALRIKAGSPLNPQLEREDIVALQTFYASRGNAEVQISPRATLTADKTGAEVVYTVAEGPRISIGDVIVRGNSYTKSEVILRKADIDKGEPFSYNAILESQRNLYRLGIFQRADIQPESAGTSVDDRNVVIQVEEGKNLTVSGSLGLRARRGTEEGAHDITPRLAAAVANRNLFGTGRYLGLEAVTAGKEEQQAFLTYREPFVGRFNIPLQLTVFQTNDATRKEMRILQRGTSIEASKIAFLRTRWSMQYQYKISKCDQGKTCTLIRQGVIVPGVDRSLLDIQISSVTPTFFWDKRDDVVDPHRGFFTSASFEYAFPLFSADANFTKEFVQGAWYLPVSQRSVFVLSSRVGLAQPHGRIRPGITNPIPLSERFTAGGDTSLRAYPLDLLGQLCEDSGGGPLGEDMGTCQSTLYDLDDRPGKFRLAPIGGNGVFILNAEYRFPIVSSVGGAVFTDIGNVFASDTIRFDDLRYGVGTGFRYLSPLGPLRFDIAWPLNRRVYDKTFSYSITLGFPF